MTTTPSTPSAAGRAPVMILVIAATLLGLMGTDLVLPAVPTLPEALGGDAATAQLVLASYVAGTCAGLLAYGALADRFATRTLFVGSLALTAGLSLACALAPSVEALVVLRLLQGAVAAGPAVFAPGIIRALHDGPGAVRALGLLGSVEALAPAFAPLLGVWLLALGGWRLSFTVIAGLALLLALVIAAGGLLPQTARRAAGSYARLLSDLVYLRYALSQAFTLGGLLTFVFGMPAVFVRALGGDLGDFVTMQIAGIATFMLAANLTGRLSGRFGAERLIAGGTLLSLGGAAATLTYALAGGTDPMLYAALFVPVNAGLGLRGPPGFYRAVVAAGGDDARGSALVILGILAATALGTVAAAPFIERGPAPLALTALVLHLLAALTLAVLPRLKEQPAD
ncbi:MAG TPA: MFS transporter [Azospirillaceae bacterium]|nr:MFS transporter [Azospirillaceae bacterium]